jgi:hypothetical protein
VERQSRLCVLLLFLTLQLSTTGELQALEQPHIVNYFDFAEASK